MKLWPFTRGERSLRLTPDAEATVRGAGFGMDAGAGTTIGRSVSTERALGTSAVYSCVTLLAKLVGGMPLGTWRRGPDASVLPVSGTPLANLLRYEPMPGVTAKAFWFTVVAHLLLRGNAFLMKVKVQDTAGRSRVSELRIVHPDRVDVRIDENGQKVFRIYGSSGHKDFTRDDVIHIVGMSFGTGLVGHSVIAIMRHRLSAHVAASDHQDELLSNGLTAKAKLKIPGIYDDPADDEQRNLIRASLRKFYGGARNAGNNVIFLDRDWDLDAISINPHDAQFLEQYRFTFTEVAGWFNIPPGAIGGADGGGKGLFYTSAAMNDLDLLKKGVRYWVEAIESALLIDPDLFGVNSGRFPRFNVDSLLEVDIMTRYQAMEIATRIGMASPNDNLRIEGRPLREDEGGDMYVTPALAAGGTTSPTTTDTPKEGTDDAPAAG